MSYQLLEQDIIPSISPRLYVYSYHISDAGRVAKILRDRNRPTIGLSIQLSNRGDLDAIVLSTGPYVHYISCDEEEVDEENFFFSKLLNSQFGTIVGFNMARLALHIYRALGVNSSGVDLSTVHPNCRTRLWNPSELVLRKLYPLVDKHKLDSLWYGKNGDTASRDACLRAWISAKVSEYALPEIRDAKRVTTHLLEYKILDCLGRLVTTLELLDAAKPTSRDNEFESVEQADGQLVLQNSRFKTRVRRSNQTSVLLSSNRGGDVVGRAIHAHGRSTNIQVLEGNFRGGVKRVRVVGREEATYSEVVRDLFLLQLLRGEISIRNRPFIDMLWFSSRGPPIVPIKTETAEDHPSFAMLNISQCAVAAAMITPTEPLVIAHGPPGTGKTTTIAAAVNYWSTQNVTVWIVARSNVAVRNIARSLLSNEVSDFKLLVSKEFYLEWHEDLYARLQKHLIRSDDLFNDSVTFERRVNGSRVVLCTLSMLSNPALDEIGVFDLLPVERLVVDEASQIDTFEFMPLFYKFKRLRKVCLFGDPQQLPPFGQEIASEMKSIFDIRHLQPNAYFLSTQYRLPIPLGDFISDQVYKSELRSEHWNESMSCIRLVDVPRSEEERSGNSFLNREEVNTVVHLICHYYRERDFCIITPYDAQRAAIQKRLQAECLPHDRVFNVDSFQGHEAAYVIVSAVRTKAPGFLRFRNRMNVMLTRCEAGMVIVTNKRFIQTCAKDTLLGNLARHWEVHTEKAWVDSREVANQTAEMPGVSSTRQKSLTYSPVEEPSTSITSRSSSQPLSISHRNSNGPSRNHDVHRLRSEATKDSLHSQERIAASSGSTKAALPPYEGASLTSRQLPFVMSARLNTVNTAHKENMAHPFRGDRYIPQYY